MNNLDLLPNYSFDNQINKVNTITSKIMNLEKAKLYGVEIKEVNGKPVFRKVDVVKMLDNGVTKKELVEIYGLNVNQVKKALDQMGLSSYRAKKVDFIIEDDGPFETVTSNDIHNNPANRQVIEESPIFSV